jgi:D-alanyl-lipoteichoic acid acyltransferase DltB (MBOAT superfamily)
LLFNSYIFIFIFLPITLTGFYLIGGRGHHRIAISWLVGASLFFYGWWNPAYLGLILASILVNYALGVSLGNRDTQGGKGVLALGITFNLGLIGYFKYANFFINNINWTFGSTFHLETIILPLAISFFTFQQIAYLVDAYKGETREYNFLHYCLFVTFFPQLIAGPIVYHKEMLPQFARNMIYRLNHERLPVGLTIFIIGLFKKVALADEVAKYATPVFNIAEQGGALTFFEGWGGALAYTLQLYFDFSGYSDMAIGLACMFGIHLPLNFNSPYKAVNIIEFWRRWHMTLSRFMRDYLYIPLGGNRQGNTRRFINLMLIMFLGGLWHGAGWTFVLWGVLHGFYLVVNHAWHAIRRAMGHDLQNSSALGRGLSGALTFTAVVISWVLFRAESFSGAAHILHSMAGVNGISLPVGLESHLGASATWLKDYGIIFNGLFYNGLILWDKGIAVIAVLLLATFFLPNTQQFMKSYRPPVETSPKERERSTTRLQWKPSIGYTLLMAITLYLSINFLTSASEFLYFNF